MNYIGISGDYTASDDDRIAANTTAAAISITLPSWPAVGDEIEIIDVAGTFSDNSLTVLCGVQPIAGAKEDLVTDADNAAFRLIYSGGNMGWQVIRFQ